MKKNINIYSYLLFIFQKYLWSRVFVVVENTTWHTLFCVPGRVCVSSCFLAAGSASLYGEATWTVNICRTFVFCPSPKFNCSCLIQLEISDNIAWISSVCFNESAEKADLELTGAILPNFFVTRRLWAWFWLWQRAFGDLTSLTRSFYINAWVLI